MKINWLLLLCIAGCTRYTPESEPLVGIQIQDRNGFTETISHPDKLARYEEIDFLTAQPFKKVVRVYKKEGKSHSTITTYHPNGQIAQYLEAQEMRAHGAYKEWFSTGQIKIEASVIGGTADVSQGAQKDWLFNGLCRVWNEEGQTIAQIPYEKGAIQGTCVYFYPSGEIQKIVPYAKNMEEGETVEYYESGRVRSKVKFSKGIRQGASLGFFESGSRAWEEHYADGLLLRGIYYSSEGEPLTQVEDGRGIQAHFEGDRLAWLMEIKQGAAEGWVKKFNAQEELEQTYSTKCGRKHGEEISYYPLEEKGGEVRPKLSIQWDQGAVHGIVKTWYRSGRLQSQREYCRNQKSGSSCAWYRNGSLMLVEEYEAGKIIRGAYYKKGQNDPTSTILNGNGAAYLYDEDGVFLKKITYIKGKAIEPETE